MLNPLDPLIGFIARHRVDGAGRFVMPYLVVVMTAILFLDLVLVSDTRNEGEKTRQLTVETRQLAKKVERIARETRHFAKALRNAVVRSCNKNGNPIRRAVRKMIHLEIERSRQIDYSKLFPDFPPDELDKLIRRNLHDQRQTIGELKEVDCAGQYPVTAPRHPAGR